MTYTHTRYFALELSLLATAVVLPLSVNAGPLSVFFDTASADPDVPSSYVQNTNPQTMPLLRAALNIDPNPAKGGGDVIVDDGALVSAGDIIGSDKTADSKTANGEISTYVVREGDTLSQIAEMFDINAKTILWANGISNPSKIRPGDSLIILPITGVRHVVKKGDSLASIAKKYSGDVDDIIAYNQLASATDVREGDTVVVPGGTMAVEETPVKKKTPAKAGERTIVVSGGGSSGFTNPIPGAIKTQGIHGYNGVDLSGVPVGTAVLAAAAGEVIVAKSGGWNGGYGSYVVVKHPNGTQTLYGHLSSVAVVVGQKVGQGQKIGGMGNTGRSTGPHLHFEVRGARNPF